MNLFICVCHCFLIKLETIQTDLDPADSLWKSESHTLF